MRSFNFPGNLQWQTNINNPRSHVVFVLVFLENDYSADDESVVPENTPNQFLEASINIVINSIDHF